MIRQDALTMIEHPMMRDDAFTIVEHSIRDVLPDKAVKNALQGRTFLGNVYVIAIGKAAWVMANTAKKELGDRICQGMIITKHGHSKGALDGFEIIEAGHPVPDENSIIGAQKAVEMVKGLHKEDEVIVLLSGGGSSLFEQPAQGITLGDIQEVTQTLLRCGANIAEINAIRKRLSAIKGGKFALHCAPAKVYAIILSDVLGDRLDMIASGPTYQDLSTCIDVEKILKKYGIGFEKHIMEALSIETPKKIHNTENVITGSVGELCRAAAKYAEQLGYTPYILSTTLDCEAREAGKFMASIVRGIKEQVSDKFKAPCAIIVGGETVVKVQGNGLGGRNQEIALSAAMGIEGLQDAVIFSIGSDGTDGPTEAAGGIVDGSTALRLREQGIDCEEILKNNNSYYALRQVDGLIITGATGTNVNDITVALCR